MAANNRRKFISAMQVSLDGFIQDGSGNADWIGSWSDSSQLIDDIDLFLLGGKMYPGYGDYWKSIYDDPKGVPPMQEITEQQGHPPSDNEVKYAQLAAKTPHIILSTKAEKPSWPDVTVVRDITALRTLKDTPGKNTYVVGGPGLIASLLDAQLIDELRLIVHTVILGSGRPLFSAAQRQQLELIDAKPGESGRVTLSYRVK